MTDLEIYRKVRAVVMAGAGGMMAVQVILSMLDALVVRFGDEFTIDGALAALERMVWVATLLQDDLRKAKEANHV